MNQVETAELLTLISQFNGMTVDKAKVIAWHDMIEGLSFAEARAGVMHYFRSGRTEWLQPGHLFGAVKEARAVQKGLERAQEARTAPQIESVSIAPLSESEKAQKRSQRQHSPHVAALLAEARAKLAPSKPGALKIGGSMSSPRQRSEAVEEVPRGREPQRLGGLLRVVSSRIESSTSEAA